MTGFSIVVLSWLTTLAGAIYHLPPYSCLPILFSVCGIHHLLCRFEGHYRYFHAPWSNGTRPDIKSADNNRKFCAEGTWRSDTTKKRILDHTYRNWQKSAKRSVPTIPTSFILARARCSYSSTGRDMIALRCISTS